MAERSKEVNNKPRTHLSMLIRSTSAAIIILMIISGCANQLPPGGGDVDTTPPEITAVYPADGTTKYAEDYFELDFSEYVDKRSFREAIFISPAVDGELDISWTGRSATVTFPKGLREDFTYVVTIGTDVVDINNRNRMAQSFSFSFATGDKIDTRKISGKVSDREADGVLIYAYRVKDDTTNYLKMKPDYVSQAGKDGTFTLNGLAEDRYRVFAVKDMLRDMLFQAETDRIGMPFSDISLTGEDTLFTGLNFFLMSADTTKPRLASAVMTDRRHILVTTTKAVDSTIITASNFSIIDSTENYEYAAAYAFKGNTKPEELVVVTDGDIPFENNLYLRADRLLDKPGNLFTDDKTILTISERADTSGLKIFRNFPPDLKKLDFRKPVLRFYFDDAFSKEQVTGAVALTDTLGNRIQAGISFPDDATIEIAPAKDLQAEKDFILTIDLSKIGDASGNVTDTTLTFMIRTISGLEFTGVSGRVRAAEEELNLVLVLASADRTGFSYKTKPDEKNEFSFDRIEAGKYILWGFHDENGNGTYDAGYPSPLEYSERFFVNRDTLELKPRWSLTDILFEFK